MSEMEIPEGWELKTVDNIGEVKGGKRVPVGYSLQSEKTEHPYLSVKDLKNNSVKDDQIRYLDNDTWTKIKNYSISHEDVYFTIAGTIGDIGEIPENWSGSNLTENAAKICNLNGITKNYLIHVLQSNYVQKQINEKTSRVGVSKFGLSKIRNLKIPVPNSIETQNEIVTKLNDIMTKLEENKKEIYSLITKNIERINFFEKNWLSYLIDNEILSEITKGKTFDLKRTGVEQENIFNKLKKVKTRIGVPDIVVESEFVQSWDLPIGWTKKSIGELLHYGIIIDLKDGNHGETHPKKSDFTKNGMPFITSAQVKNFTIDYDGADKLEGLPLKQIKIGFAKKGDVILTHKGSVGRVAIAKQDCILSPQTTYYRLNPTIIDNEFLMWFFVSMFFINQRLPIQKQTTRDYISIQKQYNFFVLLPPLIIQKKLVQNMKNAKEKFKEQKTQFEKIKQNYESRIKYIDHIQSTILDSAFSGKLIN